MVLASECEFVHSHFVTLLQIPHIEQHPVMLKSITSASAATNGCSYACYEYSQLDIAAEDAVYMNRCMRYANNAYLQSKNAIDTVEKETAAATTTTIPLTVALTTNVAPPTAAPTTTVAPTTIAPTGPTVILPTEGPTTEFEPIGRGAGV